MVDTDLDFYGILHFCPEYLEFKAQQTDLKHELQNIAFTTFQTSWDDINEASNI